MSSALVGLARTRRYEALKQTALKHSSIFWEFVDAVRQIHDENLWDEEFESWKDFCESVVGLTRQRVHQLMEAAGVRDTVRTDQVASTVVDTISERGLRELGKIPSNERPAVVKDLAKTGKPVTAEAIKARAASTEEKAAATEPIQLDDAGNKIPFDCLMLWNRRQEVQDILTWISKARSAMERAVSGEKKDPLYWNVLNTVVSDLDSAYKSVSNAKPYAVCCVCKGGAKRSSCKYCGTTGLMAKFNYDRQSKAEAR